MRNRIFTLFAFCSLFCSLSVNGTIHTVTAGASGNTFSPSSFTMALGDTVMWVIGSGTHNTLSTAVPTGALNWSSGTMSGSSTFIYVPTVNGTYFYECSFHSGMTGQFVVSGCSAPTTPTVCLPGRRYYIAGHYGPVGRYLPMV